MFADLQSSCLRALFVAGLLVAALFSASSIAFQDPLKGAGSADPRFGGLRPIDGAKKDPRTSKPGVRAAEVAMPTSYGKLPLSFEPNTGQTNPAVKFLSRGRGYTLWLTSDEAVLGLRSGSI